MIRSPDIRWATLLIAALACSSEDDTSSLEPGAQPVRVDAGRVTGVLRSLQGAHFDPGPAGSALSDRYAALGVDIVRTHDAAVSFPGPDDPPGFPTSRGDGDIDGPGENRLFPRWEADPADPASYNFGPTDAVLANIRAIGAEIFFRVGRSATSDFGGNVVPDDFDKYADIVRHVVMHYNQGWAGGFAYGIRYFEIWNEPDFLPFWAGTPEQYYDLYAKVSAALKSVDATLLVGGPAISTFNDYKGTRASFLTYLRDNQLPLDFYSYHKYTDRSNDPLDYARMAQSYRDELDSFGFGATRLVNSEYGTSLQPDDPLLGGDAGRAAFAAQALIFMQDSPVDLALSYMPIPADPNKENLGFSAVSRLKATPSRLWSEAAGNDAYAVLAGTNPDTSEIDVLISHYEISPLLWGPLPGGNDLELNVPGLGTLATLTLPERRTPSYPPDDGYELVVENIPSSWGDVGVEVYRLDRDHDLARVSTASARRAEDGSIRLSGQWARFAAEPPTDPVGVAPGVDLIVLKPSN